VTDTQFREAIEQYRLNVQALALGNWEVWMMPKGQRSQSAHGATPVEAVAAWLAERERKVAQ
jgi:site-specific recombinase XerC